ncbi:MAG: (Fe-S)-binding protein [Bacteriovoracaceae bacterium]
MMDIKHSLIDKMPAVMAGTEGADTRVIDSVISYEEVWACTTCYACVDQCPVGNNHVDAIIDMRRAYVLSESKFPTELQNTYKNMENNSNPWGVGAHQRADWAKGLDVKIMGKLDKPEDVEYLYWVGCAGSFDERNKKISRALVNVLNHAKVDFAILGEQETCTGDSARRSGNEYLYQTMATGNVELFNNYKVKKVITGCPHCFNTIKNEYPQFGGNYEVIHHSQLITNLIADGKIKVDPTKNTDLGQVTLHDACYLGRYNGEFDAPRSVIENAIGKPSVDIEKSKSESMCCGAGGAQMWMEEHVGDRVNVTRTNQLLEAKPNTIATNCPFCITMVSDGIKAKPEASNVKVLDIAEIIESSLV